MNIAQTLKNHFSEKVWTWGAVTAVPCVSLAVRPQATWILLFLPAASGRSSLCSCLMFMCDVMSRTFCSLSIFLRSAPFNALPQRKDRVALKNIQYCHRTQPATPDRDWADPCCNPPSSPVAQREQLTAGGSRSRCGSGHRRSC
jgi:hypothetical protein